MNFELVFKELLRKFDEQNVRFALIGGFAMHLAGFTRATDDIDFLVEAEDLVKVKDIMKQLGYELTHESREFSNYWHPMAPLGCVDYLHAHREYSRKMLARAKKHEKILDNIEIPVLVPEDIIGLKIQSIANNPQRHALDMADIEYLIREKSGELDFNVIKEYFNLFDKGPELEALLKRIKDAK
jgi:predicted nucleotidyltransferase